MSDTPILAHRTSNSTCPVCTGHPGGPTNQKLQRSESNDTDDVAGAPDYPVCTGLSGVHRTVQCAIEQTASQRPLLVVGAINTPTTPTFIASKFSTSQPLTRARHSILDTPKRSNPLQIPHNALVIRERFACVLSSSCAWIAFSFLDSFLRSTSLVIKARDTNFVVVLVGTLCSK